MCHAHRHICVLSSQIVPTLQSRTLSTSFWLIWQLGFLLSSLWKVRATAADICEQWGSEDHGKGSLVSPPSAKHKKKSKAWSIGSWSDEVPWSLERAEPGFGWSQGDSRVLLYFLLPMYIWREKDSELPFSARAAPLQWGRPWECRRKPCWCLWLSASAQMQFGWTSWYQHGACCLVKSNIILSSDQDSH